MMDGWKFCPAMSSMGTSCRPMVKEYFNSISSLLSMVKYFSFS